jgi:hypothetical protein
VDREQFGLRARVGDCLTRLLQLDPLDAVRGEDRHPLAVQLIGHLVSFLSCFDDVHLGR